MGRRNPLHAQRPVCFVSVDTSAAEENSVEVLLLVDRTILKRLKRCMNIFYQEAVSIVVGVHGTNFIEPIRAGSRALIAAPSIVQCLNYFNDLQSTADCNLEALSSVAAAARAR